MAEIPTASRRIANLVGAPRALKWVTNNVVAALGDAGVALLNTSGRSLQIDTVIEDNARLSPFVFDSRGAAYAGNATALRDTYRSQWSPCAPASPLTEARQAVGALIASLIAEPASAKK